MLKLKVYLFRFFKKIQQILATTKNIVTSHLNLKEHLTGLESKINLVETNQIEILYKLRRMEKEIKFDKKNKNFGSVIKITP